MSRAAHLDEDNSRPGSFVGLITRVLIVTLAISSLVTVARTESAEADIALSPTAFGAQVICSGDEILRGARGKDWYAYTIVPSGSTLRLELLSATTWWYSPVGSQPGMRDWYNQRGLYLAISDAVTDSMIAGGNASEDPSQDIIYLPIGQTPPPYVWQDVPREMNYSSGGWLNNGPTRVVRLHINDNYPLNSGSEWSIHMTNSGFVDTPECDWLQEQVKLAIDEASVPNPSELYEPPCAGDPCGTLFGNFFETITDLNIAGRGPPLKLQRTYNTVNASKDGPLGFGWRHNYQMQIIEYGFVAIIIQENGSTVKFARLPGGAYAAPPRVLATLKRNADNSWVFTRRETQFFEFNPTGQLTGLRDLNGYRSTLTYDGQNRLNSVTDASNRSLIFAYGGANRISSVTDPAGRVVRYSYGSGNLTTVTDVGGGVTTYGYDGSHRVTTKLDPNQQSLPSAQRRPLRNSYDAQGKIVWQEDRLGNRTAFSYQLYGDGSITTVTDPRGNKRLDWYDGAGQRVAIVQATGTSQQAAWNFQYDPATFGMTKFTDPTGRVTTMSYDSGGNLTSTKDPLGRETRLTYNKFNQPLTVTDPSNVTTTFRYDNAGNLTSTERPLVGTTSRDTKSFRYDGLPGDVSSVTDATSFRTTFTYDANGYLVAAENPAGKTRWLYDNVGRQTGFIPPNGNATPDAWYVYIRTFTTNAFGDVTSESHPGLGRQTTTTYDANRNITSVKDPTGKTTRYEYDKEDRLTAVVRPDGTRLETTYDANGNVTAQRNGAGLSTTYTYDAHNRLASQRLPTVAGQPARTTSFGYDSAGRLTRLTDPMGRVTTYNHDAANQLTQVDYSDPGTPDVTFEYDALGRRTRMNDGTGLSTYTYDSLSRLITSTHNFAVVGYEYDLAGRMRSITYPGNKKVSYVYNNAKRVTSMRDWLFNDTDFTWDANGNLLSQSMENDVTTTKSYNFADELTGIAHNRGTTTLASWNHSRNLNGYLASANPGSLNTGSETYTYNQRDQIQSINNSPLYGYDAADNMTSQVLFSRVYNQANQLTNQTSVFGNTTYQYDANGNRTHSAPGTAAQRVHVYDQTNQLKSVSGSAQAAYMYNGDGLRTSKTTGGVTNNFVWDLSGDLPMLIGDGTNAYIYGPEGLPVAHVDQAGNATYYGQDAQGSTRILTNQSGNVVGSYKFEAYGLQLEHTGSATTPFRYAGQYTDDETGYQYLRARYYDPGTAQFLTRDPIEDVTREAYGYAGGNPLNYSDPSGLVPILIPILIGAAGGAAWDVGIQALGNMAMGCDPFSDINWTSVAFSAGAGAVGGGASALLKARMATRAMQASTEMGAVERASRAAFQAADDIESFAVKTKHLPGSGGGYSRFAQGVDSQGAIQEALRSQNARFLPNPNIPETFRVVADVGRAVGTKGQTSLRVIVSWDGRIINAFPVKTL